MTAALQTACCIVGGGPAGMVLGFLLARAGVDVTVLEKHKDFNRDFRGDTIHPATLEVLHELGLLEAFLEVPHQKIQGLSVVIGGQPLPLVDLTHLPTTAKYIALMPQWDFLSFLAAEAKKFPTFHLRMEHNVSDLIHEGGCVVGACANTPSGPIEVRAPLTVGCDGRHATTTGAAHFSVIEQGVPIDVLWFRVSRRDTDPENALGYFNYGTASVLIDRSDYWQIAFLIRKGKLAEFQAQGLDNFRARLGRLVPFLAEPDADGKSRIDEITNFDQLKLLTVQINHLHRWYAEGILCIGDAAHAMSPVGGIGINIAIQDAVAAANILSGPLQFATMSRPVPTGTLAEVQNHRATAVRLTQTFQTFAHRILIRALNNPGVMHPSFFLRTLSSWPAARRFAGRVIGMGVKPEHVHSRRA
ncbi:MAG TPA: FAD-dependent oxidoreductase [Acidobacteriaceae bacterium]|nr:FAD-dependent oxidoreductase [Acidobacteriaceae bacterium]